MTRYNIYYTRYNILARDYVPYIKVVYTEDIYHEVGKLICTSMEKIKHISYTKPKSSEEECENYWLAEGYVQVFENIWRLDKKPEDANETK